MAETLIILAEHNVSINFADHFTKLVSNKLVFPDSVFLRVRAAHTPCSLKVVIARVVTNFFGWDYMHDRHADKDSYPHDRNVTDDLWSLIKLCFAFIMVKFFT